MWRNSTIVVGTVLKDVVFAKVSCRCFRDVDPGRQFTVEHGAHRAEWMNLPPRDSRGFHLIRQCDVIREHVELEALRAHHSAHYLKRWKEVGGICGLSLRRVELV